MAQRFSMDLEVNKTTINHEENGQWKEQKKKKKGNKKAVRTKAPGKKNRNVFLIIVIFKLTNSYALTKELPPQNEVNSPVYIDSGGKCQMTDNLPG